MKQPKYCQKCGAELIYWEQVFSNTTTYDIYTGEPHKEIYYYRAWGCPNRPQDMLMSGHSFYRVVDPKKFEWEEEQELKSAWRTYREKGQQ